MSTTRKRRLRMAIVVVVAGFIGLAMGGARAAASGPVTGSSVHTESKLGHAAAGKGTAADPTPCVVVPGLNDRCPLWTDFWQPGVDTCQDEPHAVVSGGGMVFVTGITCGDPGNGTDIGTVAYSTVDGSLKWVARYDGPMHGYDWGYAIAISPSADRVYVGGESDSPSIGPSDFVTIAYDTATGNPLWTAIYHGATTGYDGAAGVAVSPDGQRVYVAGISHTDQPAHGLPSNDFLTLSYVSDSGTLDWATRYDGPRNGDDHPFAIGVSGSSVVVTGGVAGSSATNQDLGTVAYQDQRSSHQARLLWSAIYDSGGWDQPAAPDFTPSIPTFGLGVYGSVAVTPTEVFVAGTSFVSRSDICSNDPADWSVLAYDLATGNRLWSDRFQGANLGQNKASAVLASPDGTTAYVTGYASAPGAGAACLSDATIVKYDALTGNHQWVSAYGLPSENDTGFGLALSPNGALLYASGVAELNDVVGFKTDALTQAYDATSGTLLWTGRARQAEYATIGYGYGMWVGFDPAANRVFTTGRFHASLHNPNDFDTEDYGVIGYLADFQPVIGVPDVPWAPSFALLGVAIAVARFRPCRAGLGDAGVPDQPPTRPPPRRRPGRLPVAPQGCRQ